MTQDVQRILDSIAAGNARSSEELLPLVYEELRRLADAKLAREAPGNTLQATALVHEAYLRLIGPDPCNARWDGSAHFFGAAAEAMRRILIDHARRRSAAKRAAGERAGEVSLDALPHAPADLSNLPDPDQLLALDEALEQLREEDPRAAEIVRLRYFAGLSAEEAAETLRISLRTIAREWSYARARLHQLLGGR